MHRIILSILLTTSLFAKDIIAILELEQKGLSKQEAEILTDRLTTKLISIGKYQVVERNNMDKILKEQKFQHSGCTDSECAVEIGQMLNADFIVIGSVSKFGSTYSIDTRLVDVGLGESIISGEYSTQDAIDVLLTVGINTVVNQLCGMEGFNEISSEKGKQIQESPEGEKIGKPGDPITDIDGNVYKTVQIGKQLWMAENLKVIHYENGDKILTDYSKKKWKKLETGAYAKYKNNQKKANIYGNLYNWYAVDDKRGICPDGFHVPSDEEWTILTDFLGGSSVAGGKMKEEGHEHWSSRLFIKTVSNNISGFKALPGGFRNPLYINLSYSAFFWSSTEYDNLSARSRTLDYYHSDVKYSHSYNKHYGFSVRCLGD